MNDVRLKELVASFHIRQRNAAGKIAHKGQSPIGEVVKRAMDLR